MNRKLDYATIQGNETALSEFYQSKHGNNLPASSDMYEGSYSECLGFVEIKTTNGNVWSRKCIIGVAKDDYYDDYKLGCYYYDQNGERIWVGALKYYEFSTNFSIFSYKNNCLEIKSKQDNVEVYVSII